MQKYCLPSNVHFCHPLLLYVLFTVRNVWFSLSVQLTVLHGFIISDRVCSYFLESTYSYSSKYSSSNACNHFHCPSLGLLSVFCCWHITAFFCIFSVYFIPLHSNTFSLHVCSSDMKLMYKQDCAGDSSSKWHWTSIQKVILKTICSKPCCLTDFPCRLFLLTSARTQKNHKNKNKKTTNIYLQCKRMELILGSWLLDPEGVTEKSTPVQ